ncbi:hypothetical protein SAMN04490205_1569 [Pseudomonas trivialis]|uniref:Uncharacterized protein n=1 Tax=Pseudomonas trivialis TaxID=200450 RepID=A0ABY0U656_9PSED|nr:hypothetical protein SAMN04490205_1569 [Pseudomonas trivialis]
MPCKSNPLKNRISTDQRRQMATATLADVGFFDVFAHQLRQAVGAESLALLGQEQNAIATRSAVRDFLPIFITDLWASSGTKISADINLRFLGRGTNRCPSRGKVIYLSGSATICFCTNSPFLFEVISPRHKQTVQQDSINNTVLNSANEISI